MNFTFLPSYNPYTFFPQSSYSEYQNFIMVPILHTPSYTEPASAQFWNLGTDCPLLEACKANYESRPVSNVIIQEEVKGVQQDNDLTIFKKNQSKGGQKSPKIQKENRNVASNLFRVFLKNILEVHLYDKIIEAIIQKYGLGVSLEKFLAWLASFKINFRNYIKPREIDRIARTKHSEDHQLIYRIVLRNFMQEMGISHCLTSKRLDRECCRRHLRGLKTINSYGSEDNIE